MQFLNLTEELKKLVEEDQQEVKAHSSLFQTNPPENVLEKSRRKLRLHSQKRVKRVLEIINEIGTPTESKIGWDGIEAITVIALHAKHTDMKRILQELLKAPKDEIDISLLPALIDRVRILDGKKQLFGTQWFLGYQPKPYLYPVESFEDMNERRKKYGLGVARRPKDLTFSNNDNVPPLTKKSDQHEPTKDELDIDLKDLYG